MKAGELPVMSAEVAGRKWVSLTAMKAHDLNRTAEPRRIFRMGGVRRSRRTEHGCIRSRLSLQFLLSLNFLLKHSKASPTIQPGIPAPVAEGVGANEGKPPALNTGTASSCHENTECCGADLPKNRPSGGFPMGKAMIGGAHRPQKGQRRVGTGVYTPENQRFS